ncbi:MAG: hypothetical protein JWM53_5467 [bacterium]|nr:hypothetical protein [bacterium]
MGRAFAIVVVVAALWPGSAAAQDAFEIQVYDSEIAPPRDVGLEVHVNYFASGVTTTSADGELPTDRVAHLTLEPHVGLTRWCEAGAYFQTALRPDGGFDYGGVKLRLKTRLPYKVARGLVGLALNGELSAVPRRFEPTGLGGEIRPVIDVAWRFVYASVNPILGFDFFGADAGHPQLEPAATLLFALAEGWAMGAEYYAALGPIDRPLPAASQVHRLFAVATVTYKWFGVHVGAGYGFAAGEKWIAKAILSFDLATGGTRTDSAR